MSPILKFTIDALCWACWICVAISILTPLSLWAIRSYALWKLKIETKKWTPQVGDKCMFHSVRGWIDETVTHIYDDGSFRTQRRSGCGTWSSSRTKDEVLFVSRPSKA